MILSERTDQQQFSNKLQMLLPDRSAQQDAAEPIEQLVRSFDRAVISRNARI
jgi:hypothetical protein